MCCISSFLPSVDLPSFPSLPSSSPAHDNNYIVSLAVRKMSVHCQHTVSTLSVHCRYTVGNLSVHCQHTVSTLWVHCQYTFSTLSVHCYYTVTTIPLHCFHTVSKGSHLKKKQSKYGHCLNWLNPPLYFEQSRSTFYA